MPILLLLAIVLGVVYWVRRHRAGRNAAERAVEAEEVRWPDIADAVPRSYPEWPASDGRIVVSALSKKYNGITAVDGLSFVVEPGRVTGFLGPNGAGKTTTLRMLFGLAEPTSGAATIGGVRYVELGQPIRRVGGVLEASAAHPGRTGRNHLRVLSQSAGIPLARVDEVLALVGMTAAGRRKFKEYSLGMRQRLAIAAALIGDPQVLILDEPTNGLDPKGIRWMRDLLKTLAAHGRTVLVSSHVLSEMQQLADDLVIIAAGHLVAHGSVDSVLRSLPHTPRTLVRADDVDRLAAVLGSDATITPADDGAVYVTGVDAAAIGRAAHDAGVTVYQLSIEMPDLEQVFLQLTSMEAAIR